MIALDDVEIVLTGDRVTIPFTIAPPVQRGSVDVWLSTARGGPPARGALVRQLAVRDGVVPPFALYARDLAAQWPKGGRAWLVVSYAGTVLGTGVVRVVR